MRIARFTTGEEPRYALVDESNGVEELVVLSGDPMYTPGKATGERIILDDKVRLLAPVIPRSKIVAIGRNYAEHATEIGELGARPGAIPDERGGMPLFFIIPNTAIIGPDDPIVLPSYSEDVQLEAELAIVIGRMAKDISPENAAEYIYGYTVANDVSARDLQNQENQWYRAKAFDTSLPIGPWIETDLDWEDAVIDSYIGELEVQKGNTGDMVYDPLTVVSLASQVATLLPGDIVLTGTPAGSGAAGGKASLKHGDIVEITIEGIGTLKNPVIRR